MGGASPRPPTRGPPHGRQGPWSRERCIQGIRSLEPLGPKLPIPFMRAPRQPAIEGGVSVPDRESTGSTWNACGGLNGSPSVDDRQRFVRRGAAVAVPPASCKRLRGAARWSPWPSETKGRPLTAPRKELLAGRRGAINGTARRPAMPALGLVAWPHAIHGRSVYEGACRGRAPCDAGVRAARRWYSHAWPQGPRVRQGGGRRRAFHVERPWRRLTESRRCAREPCQRRPDG